MRQPANHEPNEKMAIFAPWKISFSTWAEYFLPATEVSVRKNSTTFFSFIRSEPMPAFWEDYDRGVLTLDEVTGILSGVNACPRAKCEEYLRLSIDMQEPVKPTEQLVRDLKAAGYKLFVLSNMSREFIAFLRRFPVYRLFDGEVVSCEEGVVKPEPEIYRRLLGRYGLDPAQTLFIDDRPANIAAAAALGIRGQLFDHSAPAATCDLLRRSLLPEIVG